MKPLMTEQPFILYIAHGVSVTGRIDAVFEREDGTWEIVDYKTGASDPDPLQLAICSRAVREIWGRRPKAVRLLLRNGEEQSPTHGDVTGVLHENALRLKELA
jgi:RecB family exonuclease